jgi:hypothetical protein
VQSRRSGVVYPPLSGISNRSAGVCRECVGAGFGRPVPVPVPVQRFRVASLPASDCCRMDGPEATFFALIAGCGRDLVGGTSEHRPGTDVSPANRW